MPETFCKDCKHDGDNVCKFTGATHTTGIECPSFEKKEEVDMKFKVDGKIRITVDDEERLQKIGIDGDPCFTGMEGTIIEVDVDGSELDYAVILNDSEELGDCYPGPYWIAEQDFELVEAPTEAGHTARAFVGHPEGAAEVKEPTNRNTPCPKTYTHQYDPPIDTIRTFDSGATRDTDQGKLDYMKALSPIVLRRYVQYLDKHRLQPDGSYRDFDNWKQGIPQEAYIGGGGRHFMDTWLLTEGYATEDNHGPVELEDTICAQLFNLMGRLHEMLKVKELKALPSRTAPMVVDGEVCH